MNHTIYQKATGSAGSKGVDFQIDLLSLFLLNSLRQNSRDWKLSTENKLAEKFDDVVLELSDGSAILLQAKHKELRKITLDQLLSTNSKNQDFSLPKYFFSYIEVKTKFQLKFVVICTNTQLESNISKFLQQNSVDEEGMLRYKDGSSFFTFSNDILSKLMQNTKIYHKNYLKNKNINKGVITEDNIKEFLLHLQFYVDFPSGNDLKKSIDKLLSTSKSCNTLLHDISYRELHQKVKEWFEQPKGEYLTENRAKAMLCAIKSEKYCEWLENFKVFFKKNDLEITDSNKRVFHVVAKEGHLLYLLHVCRTFQDSKSKILYVDHNSSREEQIQTVKSFELPAYTVLIIGSSKISQNSVICELGITLKDILQNRRYKKVVFISESNDKFAQRMTSTMDDHCILDYSVTLADLSEDTQELLLAKKNIIFQGEKVSLEELLSGQITIDLKTSIQSEILEKILINEKISIGMKLSDLNEDVSRYYIDRRFQKITKQFWGSESEEEEDIISEDEIWYVGEKIVLISDSAGTGKTTVLTNLANKIKKIRPELWVIRIELNECTKILRDALKNGRSINVRDLLNFQDPTDQRNELEAIVFSLKGMVVLMLDGIDEISPDYTQLIISLLIHSYEAKNVAKIFVTTRPHVTSEMEKYLNLPSFVLVPFTERNQIDFLTNYWTYILKLDYGYYCREYAKALIDKVASWMLTSWYTETNFSFIAYPLQARMLAEVFLENKGAEDWEGCKEYLSGDKEEPTLPERINIVNLYDMCIEKKKDVFMDKGNPSGNAMANQALIDQFEECLTYHRSLALEVIFRERDCDLFTCYKPNSRERETKVLKMGIVQKFGNKLDFVHRTFAEYFAAESVIKEVELQNQCVGFQKFLIDEILFNTEYNILRHFLDNFLQNISVPPYYFKRYKSLVHRSNRANLIHRLAREGHTEIIRFILNSVDFRIVRGTPVHISDFKLSITKENTLNVLEYLVKHGGVNIEDDQDTTPLHRAVIGCHFNTVKFLVQMGADVNINTGFTALHLAAKVGRCDIAQFLLENDADVNKEDERGCTVLHIAVKVDKRDIVKLLVKHGACVNVQDEENRTALHNAAKGKSINTVGYLVSHGANVNISDKDGRTPLYLAGQQGNTEIAEFLLEVGAKVNTIDNRGRSVLHVACKEGMIEVVQSLLQHGADLNLKDDKDRTAIHLACKTGSWDIFQALEGGGADIHTKDHRGLTALHFAAEKCIKIVHFLVKCFKDVNVADNRGRTALHLASIQNRDVCIDYLMQYGGDINIADNEGCTALHHAVIHQNYRTVYYLLDNDVNVNAEDKQGNTSLHLAAMEDKWGLVQNLVTSYLADADSTDNEGHTPLHLAVKRHHVDTVRILLELDADVNVGNFRSRTALHTAVESCDREIIELLLNNKADTNSADEDGYTPLHLVATSDSQDLVELFLEHDVHIDIAVHEGHTALHMATKRGRWYVVKLLVEFGADLEVRNPKGRTALHLAAQGGSRDVVKFLLEHGMSVNDTDVHGRTPLHLAAKRGRFEVVNLLVSYKADIHVKDNRGLKAVHLAVVRRRTEISKCLGLLDPDSSTSFSQITEEWSSTEEELEFE